MLTVLKNSNRVLIFCGCLLLLVGGVLQADQDAERATLIRLDKELDRLELLVDRAEREQDLLDDSRFRYDWLRRDLKLVREGIQEYLRETELSPRSTEPLYGSYR